MKIHMLRINYHLNNLNLKIIDFWSDQVLEVWGFWHQILHFCLRFVKWSLKNLIGQLHLQRSSWSTGLSLYDLMIYSKSIKFALYLLSNPLVLTFSFIAEIIFSQGFRLGEYGHIVLPNIFSAFLNTSQPRCWHGVKHYQELFNTSLYALWKFLIWLVWDFLRTR